MYLCLVIFFLAFASITLGASVEGRASAPKGFVSSHGRNFVLDGKPHLWEPILMRWLPLLTTQDDVEATFKEMQGAGVKVLRTWGFNAINASELAGALESNLTYYQVWNGTEWTLNSGPQGLQRLDNVIDMAGRYGIKVILTFTNNWVGYGGAELYVNWIAGSGVTHDVFYSNPNIISSYQQYVKVLVNRYKDSPTVFAWELMNEARCLGDLPGRSGCGLDTGLITKWYKQQSDYVRSLDPYHLITTGGEGQFNWDNGTLASDYNYNGQAGEDFDRELRLDNIDFATYHMYPTAWYSALDFPGSNFSMEEWGLGWISQHAEAARSAEKPLILEEFGMPGIDNKTTIYPSWVDKAIETGHRQRVSDLLVSLVQKHQLRRHPRIMPWQFGMLGLTESGGNRLIKYADALIEGASPNDGFAIYKNQTNVWTIFTYGFQLGGRF
ncbi:glycoside hydrolase [Hymenopellis radicata]|nr:glycoside hydrolase [Hymenopellis radicata]